MSLKRIIASDILDTTLSATLTIYIYWFTYHHFLSQFMVSLIGFGQLSGVLLSTLGGGISDRVNKLSFIKSLKFLKIVLLGIIFFLEGSVSIEILLPLFMLSSTIIGNLLSPTLESLIPFLVEEEDELYQVNSVVASLTQLASIMAIIVSAGYITFLSFRVVIFLSLLLAVISFVLLLGTHVDNPLQPQSVLKNINNGIRYILKTPYIRDLIPIALIMNFAFWSIFLLLPKIANDHFSFWNISYSGLELAFALGGLLGGWLFTKYFLNFKSKYSLFKITLLCQSLVLLFLGINLALLSGIISYIIMLAMWFSYAVLNTVFSIVYFGSLQVKVPKVIIGSVIGSILTLFSLVNPLAALTSGFLVIISPISILIIVFAVIMLSAAVAAGRLPSIQQAFES